MPLPLLAISWVLVVFAIAISARMVRTALSNRSLPEGLLAGFFGCSGAGYVLVLLPRTISLSEPTLAVFANVAGTLLAVPGVAIVLFTWLVFRSGDRWAGWLAWGLTGFTVATTLLARWLAVPLGLGSSLSLEPGTGFFWVTTLARTSGFAWSCIEASIFYRKARRRQAARLIDSLVANRFLLWAIWSGAATGFVLLRIAATLIVGGSGVARPVPVPIVIGMLAAGLACVGAVWLTFSPPAAYRRFIERDDPATA